MHDLTSIPLKIRIAICAVTGHVPDDLEDGMFLEADLGIDSIKMVELSQSLVQIVPEVRRAEFLAAVPIERLIQAQTIAELQTLFAGWGDTAAAPLTVADPARMQMSADRAAMPLLEVRLEPMAPPLQAAEKRSYHDDATPASLPSLQAVVGADVRNPGAEMYPALDTRLCALISNVTGHQPEDLEPHMSLEGDLGIDSIKMVELSQHLIELIPIEQQAAFTDAVPTERVLQAQTIAELLQLLTPWQSQREAAPTQRTWMPADPPVAMHAAVATPEPVDILGAQYLFLISHWAVSTCSLCTHVRLEGDFDPALARAAWNDLLARHPVLRARFEIPADAKSFAEYRFVVMPTVAAPMVDVLDLQHLGSAEQTQRIAAEVERCVNQEWELDRSALHRFYTCKLAPNTCELFFTNHHLISDGLGNQQVIREFLALYAARATGIVAELPPATTVEEYRRTVMAINAWHDPEEDRALAELLRRQGKHAFKWSPQRAPVAASRAHVRQYRFRLERTHTHALVALTRDLRVSMNTLLVASYLRVVAAAGKAGTQAPILLNLPTSGRVYPSVDASGMVGCFAQNVVLDFATPDAGEGWHELLARVNGEIEQAIGRGYDRAQTRQMADAIRTRVPLEAGRIPESNVAMFRAGMKSNLFLPYIGNTHLLDRYGPLRVVDYQAATVTNSGTLDTVVELFDGGLQMTTNYDAGHYDEAFVANVAQALTEQLRALCVNADRIAVRANAVDIGRCQVRDLDRGHVRVVAEEIMHRAVSPQDLDADLEADLGLDSLERIRIVTRLQREFPQASREMLLLCRSLNEMAAALGRADNRVNTDAADDTMHMPYRQIIAQCARTPEAIAAIEGRRSLTYRELHTQSNRVARLLRAQGVDRGSRVGLMMPRGIDLLIAVMGILKAGAAYVPMDPDYPASRLSYILDHAQIEVLLTHTAVQSALSAILPAVSRLRTLVYIDERPAQSPNGIALQGHADWARQSDADLAWVGGADDPMVVLYTSGSTGRPKGVVLAHRGYAHRHDWQQTLFQLMPGERVAQKTSICFDISVWELFWPLQTGAIVCPVDTATLRDPWALARWMGDTRIHLMHFVPSLFGEFLGAVETQTIAFPDLRQLVFSGEALPVEHVKRWFSRFGFGARLANLYGPTEASIDVSAWQMSSMPDESMIRVPIGHAMPGVHLIVLDEQMRPVPCGEQGELWIGGVQLAQGYLHDAERTAESFRPNPLPQIPCPTLYRTGDLVVESVDGSFDYRGRIDSQVKIRGYRVELGEIEAVLGSHPKVKEVAVLAIDHGDGHLRLLAWLSGEATAARELRDFLAERLPAYMLPQQFEWLSSLPKNPNGKLDRKALQARRQDLHAHAPDDAYGTNAMHVDARDANTRDANALEERIVANNLEFPVAPAQRWLLQYFQPPYQWAGFTRFRYLQPLDIQLFNQAIALMTRRHPALRTVFKRKGGVWYQEFASGASPPKAEYYDGTQLSTEAREQQLREMVVERVQRMRIEGGDRLWSIIVVKEADDRHDIWVVGHHMIGDMLSNSVLFNELWRIYSDYLDGRRPDEAESTSIVSYLEILQKLRSRESLEQQVEYWTSRFPASSPGFMLSADHPHGDNLESSSASECFALTAAEVASMQTARQRHGCSLYTLLLAPLYRALGELSGQRDVVVSHRVHGRDLGNGQRFYDCVGNFAVNYPLGVPVERNGGWSDLIADIARRQEQVPLGGVSYDLVADRLPEQIYPDAKLTPVRANYLGNREVPASGIFEFSADDWNRRFALPQQTRTSAIEVFFIGGSGKLEIEIDYSRNLYDAATMRRLGERYLVLLREMLAQSSASAQPPALVPMAQTVVPAMPVLPVAVPLPTMAATRGPLEGKVAVVTGAGRGIGRQIALKLAEQGAQVVLVSRTRGNLEESLVEVRAVSPGHHAIVADVAREEDVEAMMRETASRFGGLDILINNAGANRPMLLSASNPSEWREIVDINLMSAYLCCRSAVPLMLGRGGGKIVNLGSAASVIGYPLFSAYSASKHAVVGLTKALAEEIKQQNIQVNAVCPAFVDTRMTPQAFRGAAMPTDHVADVVLFLASPASVGITGESINIFGKQDMYAYGSDKVSMVKNMICDFRPGVSA